MRFLLLAAVLLGVAVPSASARAPRPAVCLSLSAFGPVGAVDLGWPVAAGPACLPDPTGGTSVGRLVLPRVRFTKIAVGGAHACAITGAGKVICWGDDSAGQTAVPAGVRSPRAVTAGAKHTCVITKTRGVTCWGEDGAGQADPPKFPKPVIAISAGAYHTCAVISGGGVSCWGSDEYGQSSPPSTIGAFESISAGAYHTCAVETSGDVACWGRNDLGQSDVPDLIDAKGGEVAVGGFHTCVLDGDGSSTCWGFDYSGQATVPDDLGPATDLSLGLYNSCALLESGRVRCWGSDDQGQSTPPRTTSQFASISLGGGHACAISAPGDLSCWGNPADDRTTVPSTVSVVFGGPARGVVRSEQGDISCGAVCADAFASDDIVDLGVEAGPGVRFSGWGGDCAGQTTICELSTASDRVVKANFAWDGKPCRVPAVVNRPLAAARTAIGKAGCKVGRISRKASARIPSGRVAIQDPTPGSLVGRGTPVLLTVSRGKR